MNLSPARARLYWETLRHLKPVQIYARLWFRTVRPRPDMRIAPPLRQLAGEHWVWPAERRQSHLGPDEFCFLNETRRLSPRSWDEADVAKLWRYNLHYFDDLNAKGAERRSQWHRALIGQWIAENPPSAGTGWEPYPTSLRIVNWIKWSLRGNSLAPEAVHSLAVQVRWLRRRLERHLLGNHLFANAKALVFAGCFFDGPEADGWLDEGMRILAREMPEQILPDGGQFELSPMYHALALEDMLDLVNITNAAASLRRWHSQLLDWRGRIGKMRHWLSAMSHPDREIAFFNDAAIGIAPSPAELERYALQLGFPSLAESHTACTFLPDSGYIRLQAPRAVAILDVARVGPNYLPGHAHADTLSFELSIDGRRVLVNSGTSVYGDSPERLRQRSTAAHNTVTVDGESSSEVWSGFRVARRATPKDRSITQEGEDWIVNCAHDGYRRLRGRPRHIRGWRFGPASLIVSDTIDGDHDVAEATFHFHPDVTVSLSQDGRSGIAKAGENAVLRWRVLKGSGRLADSTWHPEFGVSLPSRKLLVGLQHGNGVVQFSWSGE